MRLVDLTGGIASDKSTVSRHLESQGLRVVDADKVARVHFELAGELMGMEGVVATFGEGMLREDGEVDRAKLGEIIYNDPAKRGMLNRALQPCISLDLLYEVFKHWIHGTSVVIMDIPLLFEMKLNYVSHPVVVVWVDRAIQETRLTKRDNSAIDQGRARINSLLPLDKKREQSGYVRDNSGTLEDTMMQVDKLKSIIHRCTQLEGACPVEFRSCSYRGSNCGAHVAAFKVMEALLIGNLVASSDCIVCGRSIFSGTKPLES